MEFLSFPDGEALSQTLARAIATALARACAEEGAAALAVSGGRTPTRFFAYLSRAELPWERITVTLVDERWVPETSPRSNAALVRRHLLREGAEKARFLPLFRPTVTPEESLPALEDALSALPPLAAAVLGMGEDGHTASFFPGGDRLAEVIDPHASRRVLAIRAPAAGEPRVTLTLPVLLKARALALHIEGGAKKDVLDTACGGADEAAMPVRAVLARASHLKVFWCP